MIFRFFVHQKFSFLILQFSAEFFWGIKPFQIFLLQTPPGPPAAPAPPAPPAPPASSVPTGEAQAYILILFQLMAVSD